MAEGLGLEPGTSFRTADIFKRHKQVYTTFVDKDDKGEPVATFLSAVPHRVFDTHRLMDGVPLRIPAALSQAKEP